MSHFWGSEANQIVGTLLCLCFAFFKYEHLTAGYLELIFWYGYAG